MNDLKRQEINDLIKFEQEKEKKIELPETKKMIEEIHKSAIISEVNTNEAIKNKFVSQAQRTVDNELESINQENISRRQKTTYDANKEACKNYGIDDSVPLWQIRLMKFGSGVWFVIYWIFATLTIAPINIFFKGIKAFIKTSWIVFIFALICYLIIVAGIPLLIKYFG